jgi:hypothetical protein
LINLIGFNIIWFGLVYWGNAFIPLAFIFLLVQLTFFLENKKQFFFIVVVCLIGNLTDSLLQYFGVFIFVEMYHLPFWLMMLWGCFAATLSYSLSFLGRSKLLQITLGFCAPLSYIAGDKLGAVDFGYSIYSTYCILSILWVLQFLLFFKLQSYFIDKGKQYV